MKFKTLITMAAIACGTPAVSQTINGNALYEMCENPERETLYSFCLGYITGVWEGTVSGASNTYLYLGQDGEDSLTAQTLNSYVNQSLGVCVPNEATTKQMLDIVTQYLGQNPKLRHQPARFTILEAYRGAFPCAK